MATVFADASYWIALSDDNDQHAESAKQARDEVKPTRFITTDAVIIEYLAHFSRRIAFRQKATAAVRSLFNDSTVQVVPHTRARFWKALQLYERRADKTYSLTDCFSVVVMREFRIKLALTTDPHFEQEGLVALMKRS